MRIGLQISSFDWPGGPSAIGPTLATIVRSADDVGFDSIWVMDHFFQIRSIGPEDDPMLEGWTTLGYMAAHSTRARLGLMVGGVHYRQPGLWIKAATTLDVLSGGRGWFGIGAAWNESESRALGFPFPPLGDRFELLEDTLRMAHAMFEGDHGSRAALDGRQVHAGRLINSPQSLSRPRVPIMIGGGGEQKTLRMVAQYGDATNVFGDGPRIAHKYRVLREHCDRLGRDYDEIERTTMQDLDVQLEAGGRGASPARIVERFGELADAGAQHIIVTVRDLADPARLERIGRDVIPQLRSL